MLFTILVVIILGMAASRYISGYVVMKRRDRLFEDLARTYNLQISLDHDNYSYDYKVPAGKSSFELRTLRGIVAGKNVAIQDRINAISPLFAQFEGWRGILKGPSSFWFYRFYNPFTSFGRFGAQTVALIDEKESDVSGKEFWGIVAFASRGKMVTLLNSLRVNNVSV